MKKALCSIACAAVLLFSSSTVFASSFIGDAGLWYSKYREIPLYNDVNGTSHRKMGLNDQFFSITKTAISTEYEPNQWLKGSVLSGTQAGRTGYSLKRNMSRTVTIP